MGYWEDHWSKKTQAGHRSTSAEFLKLGAEEKLFLMGKADSLLDFGCGAAELLSYIAPHYKHVVGVDFSAGMLESARKRLEESGVNAELVQADDSSVWSRVSGTFDHITTTGVIQYLTLEQIDAYLKNAASRLNPGGTIGLFDIIDPPFFFLFYTGQTGMNPRSTKTMLINAFYHSIRSLVRKAKGESANIMGKAYAPISICELAKPYGLKARYVCSLLYEYRYHLLFTKDES